VQQWVLPVLQVRAVAAGMAAAGMVAVAIGTAADGVDSALASSAA